MFLWFIPVGILAFVAGILLESPSGQGTRFDTVAYPTVIAVGLVLAVVLLLVPRNGRLVVLSVASVVGIFLSLKLAFALFGSLAPGRVLGQLTESFFWSPVVYLVAFMLPTGRSGPLVASLYTVAILGVSVTYLAAAEPEVRSWSVVYALVQLNLANAVFLGMTAAFTRFQEAHLRTRARLELAERLLRVDPLTQLANRRGLEDDLAGKLARADRTGEKVALLFMDIDGFKSVNDALGHEAGDAVLVRFAERLRDAARTSDAVGRISGDEFVVVADGLARADDAVTMAASILRKVRETEHLEGRAFELSASIGVSIFPDDAADGDALLRSADAAMYRVKRTGKNGVHRYQPGDAPVPPHRAVDAKREATPQPEPPPEALE